MSTPPLSLTVTRCRGPRSLIVLALASTVVLSGCIEGTASSEPLPPIATAAAVATSIVEQTTTSTTIPPELIIDCIDWVMVGVQNGNGIAIKLWDDSFRDLVTLAQECGALDMSALEELSRQWNEMEEYINPGMTSVP